MSTDLFDRSIGLGLACTRNIAKYETICYFKGILIGFESREHLERIRNGQTEYLILVAKLWVLDCYPFLGKCKASRMNDIRKVGRYYSEGLVVKPTLNCRISTSNTNHTAKIKSVMNIPTFTELFCNYGDSFSFL